jgi:hypothetical protein
MPAGAASVTPPPGVCADGSTVTVPAGVLVAEGVAVGMVAVAVQVGVGVPVVLGMGVAESVDVVVGITSRTGVLVGSTSVVGVLVGVGGASTVNGSDIEGMSPSDATRLVWPRVAPVGTTRVATTTPVAVAVTFAPDDGVAAMPPMVKEIGALVAKPSPTTVIRSPALPSERPANDSSGTIVKVPDTDSEGVPLSVRVTVSGPRAACCGKTTFEIVTEPSGAGRCGGKDDRVGL